MAKFIVAAKKFVAQEEGAAAPEYAILVGLIAAVIVAGATLLGANIQATLAAVAGVIPPG